MGRPLDPLSPRNANRTFTGREIQAAFAKLTKSKRARKIRKADEFPLRDLLPMVRAPIIPTGAYSWDLQSIMDARDQQMIGRFSGAVRLAESMRTDDALFTAYSVRIAPVQSLSVDLVAGRKGRGDTIAAEGEALFGNQGIAVTPATVSDLRGCLANHGIAVGAVIWNPRPDGSRVDVELKCWPLEFVWWNAAARCLMTRIDPFPGTSPNVFGQFQEQPDPYGQLRPNHGESLTPIVHGDGRWVVFSKTDLLPWRNEACLLPAAMVWARHAFAMRDWAKGSASHGNAKVIGTMPEGVALQDAEGSLTGEAAAFLQLLQDVASQDMPTGLKPFGSTLDYLVNSSGAWEVWAKLGELAEKAAARIYLGNDGILGAQGGAPGVDISELFGVATTKIQSDLECINRGIQTGVIEPWCALNFGDSSLAPIRSYRFPDPDEEATRQDFAKRNAAFLADVKSARDAGLVVTQEWVDTLAKAHGVPCIRVQDPQAAPSVDAQTSPAETR